MTTSTTHPPDLEPLVAHIRRCVELVETLENGAPGTRDTLANWSLKVAVAFLETAQQQLAGEIGIGHPRLSLAFVLMQITQHESLEPDMEDVYTALRMITGDVAW